MYKRWQNVPGPPLGTVLSHIYVYGETFLELNTKLAYLHTHSKVLKRSIPLRQKYRLIIA